MSQPPHSRAATTDIRLWAVGLSLPLSLWHALLNPIPNADGFEFVRIAEVFLNDGLMAAFAGLAATYISTCVMHLTLRPQTRRSSRAPTAHDANAGQLC